MKKVVIFGATSAIAMATARRFAAKGDALFLVARNQEKLDAAKGDLIARGAAKVGTAAVDLAESPSHVRIIEEASAFLSGIDVALIAHGTLGDQKSSELDYQRALAELGVNLLSPISLLTLLANYFEKQSRGVIAVISSVAGDRGRQSNYIYGTAKGGLSIFLQGLRNRLSKAGVTVLTIKPGFVDTPMTAGMKKNALFATPESVSEGIIRAIEHKADVVYLPWFWRYIMILIKSVPEPIFKRLSL